MMTTPKRETPANAPPSSAVISRRALLTGSQLVASVLSGAALVAPGMAFDATPAENAPRYKDSEHVRTFYRVAGR